PLSAQVGGGRAGAGGQLEILSLSRSVPRTVKSLPLPAPVLCMELIPEPQPHDPADPTEPGTAPEPAPSAPRPAVCLGLGDGSLLLYGSVDAGAPCLCCCRLPGLSCYSHYPVILIIPLFPLSRYSHYPPVAIILGILGISGCFPPAQLSFEAHPEPGAAVTQMVRAGSGVWMAFDSGSSLRLFHTETRELLQEINLATRTTQILPGQKQIRVTSLLIVPGSLWVGTEQGIIVLLPVPRLEGIPKITGKAMVSLNGHAGPVQFLALALSTWAPDALRDERDEADEGGDGDEADAAEVAAPRELRRKGIVLQYRLRSTAHLPGQLLSVRPAPPEAPPGAHHDEEEEEEDGSIYELAGDPAEPEAWLRGRPCARDSGRKEITSLAVVSGGRGYRDFRAESARRGAATADGSLLIWQLPLAL
ncbi:rho guanine nucleotide exchange factor 10-like protein, partial [Malurus melanocephalus]|uniref:rho guanine nucleotide exchange factor 10-like protein n=1 Tax=Malurus melanocephalus TaxID=175006 RepID=UPI002548B62A